MWLRLRRQSLAARQTQRFGNRMLFWLKKFISFWLMPLPACVTLMVVGFVLVQWTKRTRLGRALVIGGFALLLFFSNGFVGRALIRPLEDRYPSMPEFEPGKPLPPDLLECQYIVVLGGGNGWDETQPATALLSKSALGRIVEAVRLARALPSAKIIVSGPGDSDTPTHAEMLVRTAVSLGIARERFTKIEHARDTEDESRTVYGIVGHARAALITSAWHMPRAAALCRGAGLNVLPCPADYTTHAGDKFIFPEVLCDLDSLGRSTWAIRERIGMIWVTIRGKT